MTIVVTQPTDECLVSNLPYYIRQTRQAIADLVGPFPSSASFNVKSIIFGATGNGTTYDDAAILAAIVAAQNAGEGSEVLFPPGDYLVKDCLTMLITKNIKFSGYGGARIIRKYSDIPYSGANYLGNVDGAVYLPAGVLNDAYYVSTVPDSGTYDLLYVHNGTSWVNAGSWVALSTAILWPWGDYYRPAIPFTCSAAIVKGDAKLTVDTSQMSVGDGLLIVSNESYSGSYVKGFMTRVTQVIDATHVRIQNAAPYAFTITGKTITVCVYKNTPKVTVENLDFELVGTAPVDACFDINCLAIEGFFDPSLRNISTINSSGSGIYIHRMHGGSISNIRIRTMAGNNGYGYGMGIFSAFDSHFYDLRIWASRHAIALSGIPGCNLRFSDSLLMSECHDDGVSWDAHIVESVVTDNCTMLNGIKYSGRRIAFSNSIIGSDGGNETTLLRCVQNRGLCTFQEEVSFDNVDFYLVQNDGLARVVWYNGTTGLLNMGNLRFSNSRVHNVNVADPCFFGGAWYMTAFGMLVLEGLSFDTTIAMPLFAHVAQQVDVVTPGILKIHNCDLVNVTIDAIPSHGATVTYVDYRPVLGAIPSPTEISTALHALQLVQ